ncbi:MAG TPA: TonB-dependent receptor, partial [Parafilimonas sp.]|nr:TonB-dependent receptor [Parafilimonas sp.]
FTAIPKFERYTFNPKLFLYFNKKTKLDFGLNTTFENRLGGDIYFIEGKGDSTHSYFEKNKTNRLSTEFLLTHQLNEKSSFSVKNSLSYFSRAINSNDYSFNGIQRSSYTEASYLNKSEKNDWVAGINLVTDNFSEDKLTAIPLRNYIQTTLGAFIQNTYTPVNWLTVETGLREDYVKEYGFAFLPHLSSLFKIAKGLSSRITLGFGYKPPTIFTEESEMLLYKNIFPVNTATNTFEKSYGINGDVNYTTSFNELHLSINQFFFYTHINHPLLLYTVLNNFYAFQNIDGYINSKGAETNAKLAYNDFELYLGYTYTNAKLTNNDITRQSPLTPRHRFNAALVYEAEDNLRIGSELYYFSKQTLSDGSTGRGYWLTGLVIEKYWKKFSLYINFENIGDVRQTKFESIYSGSVSNPIFKDIYAPLDGFVWNGGVIIKL